MKNKFIPVFLLLSSFFLFACGLTGTLFGTGDNQGNVDEIASSPTESIQTEEPAETQPITEEENIETPEETELPEENPVVENMGASLCNHPYFPIVDNATWTYQPSDSSSYFLTIDELMDDSFIMRQEVPDEQFEAIVEWFCTEEGILRGSFAQLDLIDQGGGMMGEPEIEFETLEWTGETLPEPNQLDVGYFWISSYTLSADVNVDGDIQQTKIIVALDHHVEAFEGVSVAGGTFPDAMRVDSDGAMAISVEMDGQDVPVSGMEFTYTTWYAEGVGMVKMSNDSAGFQSTVELVSSSLID